MPDDSPLSTNYRDRLRDIIANPDNGLLLNAEVEIDADGNQQYVQGAAFELASGKYQREYITLWGLFDKLRHFEDCIGNLAKLALDIRAQSAQWYTTIVTCTATAKHIMEHLHSKIETEKEDVEVYYLAPYPFHNMEHHHLLDFRDKTVLIVTDVIATGVLVKNLAAVVEQLGGKTVAILSVVDVKEDAAKVERKPEKSHVESSIEITNGQSVPLYSLTDYYIPALKPGQVELTKLRKINPSTILPEEPTPIRANGFEPQFNELEAFRHFEDSGALDFGFHESDGRRFTTAFRLTRLFERCGEDIWRSVKPLISGGAIIATTYGREDLRFYAFVKAKAEDDSVNFNSVFIPRSDSIYLDYTYFLTPPAQIKLADQHVVLLLSSLQTSEKLRKLVSLLALHSVSGITVICLLNRMGVRTRNFISRIRKLVRGVSGHNVGGDGDFTFTAVYNISDLKGMDLAKMQEAVEALAVDYSSQTPEPGFRSLMEQEVRYFRPLSVTARRFESEWPMPLGDAEPQSITFPNGKTFEVQSKDGKLYALCSYVAATRDYRPVIDAIRRETDKATLYQLFAILLSDVSYLRIARQFDELRDALIEAVRNQRAARLRFEQNLNAALALSGSKSESGMKLLDIEDCVEIETFFLFGLSLFSYLDQDYRKYRAFIIEVLTSGKEKPEDWYETPLNFIMYYGNERILWAVSMLLHFTQHDYRNLTKKSKFKEELKGIIDAYIRFTQRVGLDESTDDGEGSIRAKRIKIKHSFDSLLKELGIHEQRRKHQIIRYLQSHLIEPKMHHNPILKDLKRAYDFLSNNLANTREARGEAGAPVTGLPEMKRMYFSGDPERIVQLKRSLEDATHAAALLEGIADAASRLFHFHPDVGRKEAARYIAGINRADLSDDVARLRDLLQGIRNRGSVSGSEVQTFHDLWSTLKDELSVSQSPLIKALLWYIVPLLENLRLAMEDADTYLKVDYGTPWSAKLKELDQFGEVAVLVDPTLLKEVLWNICTNVRYGLRAAAAKGAGNGSAQLRFEIERFKGDAPYPEADQVEYVALRVYSPSVGQQESARLTFKSQENAIEQFGGSLKLHLDGSEVLQELRLISRQEVKQSWDQRQLRKETA